MLISAIDNFSTILPTPTTVASGHIPTIFPNVWVRSCMAINTTSGKINWVVDGNLVENNTFPELKDSKIHINLNGKIILGAVQSPTKSWWVFSNKLTNLNIFVGLLSLPVMRKRTRGDEICFEEGDYLAWSEMKWDLRGGAIIEKIGQEELDTKPILTLYSAEFPIMDCMRFCKNLGTQMPSVSNNEASERLMDFCDKKMKSISFGTWLAVDDYDDEGMWKDSFTRQPLNYTPPWVGNEPNGGTNENCAYIVDCSWMDTQCITTRHNCICESEPHPNLKLLGLCEKTLIDRDYQPQNDVNDIEKLTLVGMSSWIEYDLNQNLWVMNVARPNVSGTSKASQTSFTLGRNTWTIIGDSACTKKGSTYTTDLKLSGCKEDHFTCYDGQCINITKRCDQIPNCKDHSDEKGCQILFLEEGYNMRVPPVDKIEEEMDKIIPVPVNVSLALLKVVNIDEEDHNIEFQIQITLEWKDNRALYHNLKPETYLNALSLTEIQRLWLPLLIYTNTDQQETTRLGVHWEWTTFVSVKREGNFARSGYDMVDETQIFKGEENTLIMTQSYTHEFQCIYRLERYPFDTQVSNVK